jgi:hypothetical protein
MQVGPEEPVKPQCPLLHGNLDSTQETKDTTTELRASAIRGQQEKKNGNKAMSAREQGFGFRHCRRGFRCLYKVEVTDTRLWHKFAKIVFGNCGGALPPTSDSLRQQLYESPTAGRFTTRKGVYGQAHATQVKKIWTDTLADLS